MSNQKHLTPAQVEQVLDQWEQTKEAQKHKKLKRRIAYWALVVIVLCFVGHELAAKAVEFIVASLLDIVIQWE